jgi:hypothetical protein
MPVLQEGPLRAAGAHDQADRDARDHALQMGAPGRGGVGRLFHFAGGLPPAVNFASRAAFLALAIASPT